MKKLIVCCDGTWNTPDQHEGEILTPTNVLRLYNTILPSAGENIPQLKYYHPGVGTTGNGLLKLVDGGFALTLGEQVQSAYKWLSENYQVGDEIFLFGFSRGAFIVRSLAGMIHSCGLLNLTVVHETSKIWLQVQKAYVEGYRANKPQWNQGLAIFEQVEIQFLGVWDTVGSLGIPDDMGILNVFDPEGAYRFHNVDLGPHIKKARHAVSIDEKRASFSPTLWNSIPGQNAEQVWFPGVHADVGGGYVNTGLSNGALLWMAKEAVASGLALDAQMLLQVKPNPMDVLHNSNTGIFKLLKSQPRAIPKIIAGDQSVHQSAIDRMLNPPITQAPYRVTTDLLVAGAQQNCTIYAKEQWCETGLYLEAGVTYKFVASGEWIDHNVPTDASGTVAGIHLGQVAQFIGSCIGEIQSIFRKVTNNKDADFLGAKRHTEWPWFCLIGAVANCTNPALDGTPATHETFKIGNVCTFQPTRSGYLYCYANDAWAFYENNRGSVQLIVTRI